VYNDGDGDDGDGSDEDDDYDDGVSLCSSCSALPGFASSTRNQHLNHKPRAVLQYNGDFRFASLAMVKQPVVKRAGAWNGGRGTASAQSGSSKGKGKGKFSDAGGRKSDGKGSGGGSGDVDANTKSDVADAGGKDVYDKEESFLTKAQQMDNQTDALLKLGASKESVESLRADAQKLRRQHQEGKSPEQLEKGCRWAIEKKREGIKKAQLKLAQIAKEQADLDKRRNEEEGFLRARQEARVRLEVELGQIEAAKAKEQVDRTALSFLAGCRTLLPGVNFEEGEGQQLFAAMHVLKGKAEAMSQASAAAAGRSFSASTSPMDTTEAALRTPLPEDEEEMFVKAETGGQYTDAAQEKFARAHGLSAANDEDERVKRLLLQIMAVHEAALKKRRVGGKEGEEPVGVARVKPTE